MKMRQHKLAFFRGKIDLYVADHYYFVSYFTIGISGYPRDCRIFVLILEVFLVRYSDACVWWNHHHAWGVYTL